MDDKPTQHSSSKLVKVGELISLMNIYALGTAMKESMCALLQEQSKGGSLDDAELQALMTRIKEALDPEVISGITTEFAAAMYEELFDEPELDELIVAFRDRTAFKRLAAAAAPLNTALAEAIMNYIAGRAREIQQ